MNIKLPIENITVVVIIGLCLMTCSQNTSYIKPKAKYNKTLADRLDSILISDQKDRQMLSSVEAASGFQSEQYKALFKKMAAQDSVNIIKVSAIIDKYGWLGVDEVGETGNSCLFLVVQHASLETKLKYLPIMRAAVKEGNAYPADLAYLEDRVALWQGKKQLYGSQLRRDEAGKYYFAPIEDEINVNKRRAAMGLGKIEDRALEYGFEYKLATDSL